MPSAGQDAQPHMLRKHNAEGVKQPSTYHLSRRACRFSKPRMRFGVNARGESDTLAALASAKKTAILVDGMTLHSQGRDRHPIHVQRFAYGFDLHSLRLVADGLPAAYGCFLVTRRMIFSNTHTHRHRRKMAVTDAQKHRHSMKWFVLESRSKTRPPKASTVARPNQRMALVNVLHKSE